MSISMLAQVTTSPSESNFCLKPCSHLCPGIYFSLALSPWPLQMLSTTTISRMQCLILRHNGKHHGALISNHQIRAITIHTPITTSNLLTNLLLTSHPTLIIPSLGPTSIRLTMIPVHRHSG